MKWCLEFRDYLASTLDQLPSFDPKEVRTIDHFWAAMAKVHSIMNSELCPFSVLAKLAQVLNADPERLFSMKLRNEGSLMYPQCSGGSFEPPWMHVHKNYSI